MIKFMDEITEAIEQFIAEVGENAVFILGLLMKAFILITTPVWILNFSGGVEYICQKQIL